MEQICSTKEGRVGSDRYEGTTGKRHRRRHVITIGSAEFKIWWPWGQRHVEALAHVEKKCFY